MRSRATDGYIGTGGVVNMSPADHMGLDLTAVPHARGQKGNWVLVQVDARQARACAVGRRMSAQLTQYLLTGLTIGAIYALVALGFSIIYNASHVINFAQGEFVMIGGMTTVSLAGAGLPLPLAIPLAVLAAAAVGLALEKFAVEPARGASVVTLIIITIGASILLRGLATLVWDKNLHALQPFSGDTPIAIAGATILPQSLWVLGVTLAIVLLLSWFFGRTLLGKAMLATSHNRARGAACAASTCASCCCFRSDCRRRSARSRAS